MTPRTKVQAVFRRDTTLLVVDNLQFELSAPQFRLLAEQVWRRLAAEAKRQSTNAETEVSNG